MAIAPVCDFGWKAVDAALPGVDGRTHRILDHAGPNGLVVAFICNHCPYVKAVIERIVRDAADLKQHGVGFVAISSNDAEAYPEDSFPEMKLFAARNGFAFSYLYDEDQTVANSLWRGLHAGLLRLQRRTGTAISRPAGCLAQAGGRAGSAPRPVRGDDGSRPHRPWTARADALDRLLDQMEGVRRDGNFFRDAMSHFDPRTDVEVSQS